MTLISIILLAMTAMVFSQEATLSERPRFTVMLPHGVALEMVNIPAGTFTMGSPLNEPNRDDDEQPHEVTLTQEFWLGVYEVTQEQYLAVIGKNPSWFPDGGNFPVENITWNEAKEFCEALNNNPEITRPEGFRFDLPTEAQWEYACRAGTNTPFFWGNTLNADRANCDGKYPYGTSTQGVYLKRTTRVGHYHNPNPWGLYDMHGNVWEWTRDHAFWQNAAIKTGNYDKPQTDPYCTHGEERIYRGGAWTNYCRACRSAYRRCRTPDNRYFNIGIRVALVKEE